MAVLSPQAKSIASASAANLDTAINAQIAVLNAKMGATIKSAPTGTGTVIPGSIVIADYSPIITAADAITYTCQVRWQEWI